VKIITGVSQAQLPKAAREIIDYCKGEKIWLFEGRMGAGKTTIIKAIALQMQVEDVVSSPTFSIVNEYRQADHNPIYHFDFYRIDQPEEALDLGVEEYFYSGNYCWIEWAERISAYIPEKFVLITIEVGENDEREISLKIIDDGKSQHV
jgi:tRNA threonylcarbamoyladenosine biosynthesis protein TsaE